ncbi:MAG: acyl-CoA dehydrogenase family protein [Georgfuchsia sp.]
MNSLSADNEETLRLVAQAAADLARPDFHRTQRVRDTADGFDQATWGTFAEQGWLAALLPEEQGGTGLGIGAAAIISERLGYACYTEPFVAVAVVTMQCLMACAPGAIRNGLLEDLSSGSRIITIAWQSPRGDLSVGVSSLLVELKNGSISLHGEFRFVLAPQSDYFIVVAHIQGVATLIAIPATSAGLSIKREKTSDGSSTGWLILNGVKASPDAFLARGAIAEAALSAAIDAGALCTASELLGLMERSLEITLDYLRMRKQFGKFIGSFQVLQHRAVDMWIQKSLTRAAISAALAVFGDSDQTAQDRTAAASSAKARASQAAVYIAGQAIQLHGAIGTTDEYELGVYVNRSMTLAAQFGNAATHRRRYGNLVSVQER